MLLITNNNVVCVWRINWWFICRIICWLIRRIVWWWIVWRTSWIIVWRTSWCIMWLTQLSFPEKVSLIPAFEGECLLGLVWGAVPSMGESGINRDSSRDLTGLIVVKYLSTSTSQTLHAVLQTSHTQARPWKWPAKYMPMQTFNRHFQPRQKQIKISTPWNFQRKSTTPK